MPSMLCFEGGLKMFDRSTVSDGLSWLQNEMSQLIDEVLPTPAVWGSPRSNFPALNTWEDAENYYVEAELPGLKVQDLELSVVGQELTISGERKSQEKEGVAWHRRERPWGKFVRALELPAPVDPDKVDARFENGVLLVTLPKSEAAKPRKIEVKRIVHKS
jgi:HSP20 family protein